MGTYLHVKMEYKEPLKKAFRHFCNRYNLRKDDIVFKLGNYPVDENLSPEAVHIKGNDIIAVYNEKKIPSSSFQKDLWSMYQKEMYTDITLIFDKREFKAHKALLAARCPKFEAMFRANLAESGMQTITLDSELEYGADAFKMLLEYLYTDEVKSFEEKSSAPHILEGLPVLSCSSPRPRAWSPIVSLFCLAEEYLVPRLKDMCTEELKSRITRENAPEVLYQTDLYGADTLKQHCMGVILERPDKVLYGEAIKRLAKTSPDLMLYLAQQLHESTNRRTSMKRSRSEDAPIFPRRRTRTRRVHFQDPQQP
ncbi:hypothetical protein AAMO2058_000932600 [Amorphochlora amoebiformis]